MAISSKQIAEKLEQVEAFYERVRTAEMPETLKDAVHQGWEQVIDVLEADLKYPKEQREEDSRRIITFEAFKRVFDEWEARMVQVQVSSPLDFILAPISAIEGMWETIKEIWKDWSIYGKIFSEDGLLNFILEHLLEVVAVSTSIVMFKKLMQERDGLVAKMRKRALPRVDGPRYLRRKNARI